MEIISRKEALSLNLTTYFTGLPCHKGHISNRVVSSGSCYECRKGWTRDWRARGGKPSESFNPGGKELSSYDYLHECFSYEDGKLFWKARPLSHFVTVGGWRISTAAFSGKEAGHKHKSNKYIEVRLDNKLYKAHRIVFKMLTGKEPPMFIDHIDGNPTNNRIENLREATQQENSRSMKPRSRHGSTSAYKGVSKQGKKYICHICIDDKSEVYIFDTEIEAAKYYNYLATKYFKEFAKLNEIPEETLSHD